MKLWSISFAYRLGLGFHALNNEGSDGSNLMQPRRIDVGSVTYDGISGEIIRRHILENFVDVCRNQNPQIPMLPLSEGLHPDRGVYAIRKKAKESGCQKLTKGNPDKLYEAVRNAISGCSVIDIGGYLAPFSGKDEGAEEADEGAVSEGKETDKTKKVAPEAVIMGDLSEIGGKKEGAPYTVKRDSVFDVAWLISEQPQDLTITQHSAYRPSGQQGLFSQTMRSNTYGGVIRADLHRIGTDDYWYLQKGKERLAIQADEQRKRQIALIEAIINFIASPTGAKTAGWAPHVFLTEGAILLTSARTAPFASPIKVNLTNKDTPVQVDTTYAKTMEDLKNETDTWAWKFNSVKELLEKVSEIKAKIEGK